MRTMRLWGAVRLALPRVLPLFRDPLVPLWLKVCTVLAGLAIVSPLDLLGDIPLVGVVDDAALLALLAAGFVAFASRLRSGGRRPFQPPALR